MQIKLSARMPGRSRSTAIPTDLGPIVRANIARESRLMSDDASTTRRKNALATRRLQARREVLQLIEIATRRAIELHEVGRLERHSVPIAYWMSRSQLAIPPSAKPTTSGQDGLGWDGTAPHVHRSRSGLLQHARLQASARRLRDLIDDELTHSRRTAVLR